MLNKLAKRVSEAVSSITGSGSSGIRDVDLDAALRELTLALMHGDVPAAVAGRIRDRVRARVHSGAVRGGGGDLAPRYLRAVISEVLGDELVGTGESWWPRRTVSSNQSIGNAQRPKTRGRPRSKTFNSNSNQSNAQTQVVVMVGLQGAGKTTSTSKLAALYVSRGLSVGMVAADTMRAGAVDQLLQNALAIGVDTHSDVGATDPAGVVERGLKVFNGYKDVVLVDTAGRNFQDLELFEELDRILVAVGRPPDAIYLVVDSTQGGVVVGAQAKAFSSRVNFSGIVATKMDGGSSGGGVLSAAVSAGAPVRFVGTGEHLDQLEELRPEAFVSRLMGEADVSGLMAWARRMERVVDESSGGDLGDDDDLTLWEMREQYLAMLNPGSGIASAMSCFAPHGDLNGKDSGGVSEEEASRLKMRAFVTMCDSCTLDELLGREPSGRTSFDASRRGGAHSRRPVSVHGAKSGKGAKSVVKKGAKSHAVGGMVPWESSRVERVARGCGMTVRVVLGMLEEWARMRELSRRMDACQRDRTSRSIRELEAYLRRTNPRMLASLGGLPGLTKMIEAERACRRR